MHLGHQIFLNAAMNMLIWEKEESGNVTANKVGELVSFMSRESIQMQIENSRWISTDEEVNRS